VIYIPLNIFYLLFAFGDPGFIPPNVSPFVINLSSNIEIDILRGDLDWEGALQGYSLR
jgi:hypothetical protein